MIGIGIDTGGTYTDIVVYDMENGKVLGSGKTPTTKDTLYTEPLRLGPGSWTITAIAVNHYGLSSDPVRYFYTVTGAGEAGEGATEQAEK